MIDVQRGLDSRLQASSGLLWTADVTRRRDGSVSLPCRLVELGVAISRPADVTRRDGF